MLAAKPIFKAKFFWNNRDVAAHIKWGMEKYSENFHFHLYSNQETWWMYINNWARLQKKQRFVHPKRKEEKIDKKMTSLEGSSKHAVKWAVKKQESADGW